jgi:uncharacterized membrane protein YedE/YeeE
MATSGGRRATAVAAYYLIGVMFGVGLTKSGSISWFKVQEMFRLQSPDLYLVFVAAVLAALIPVQIIKRLGVRTMSGEPLQLEPKRLGKGYRYWIGGPIFGAGLAITGACPGPLYALIGSGATVMLVAVASAAAGMWLYGALRPKLPHY